MLVAGDDVGVLQVRKENLGLGGLAALAGPDLDDLDRAETQRPSGSRGALGVVGGEGGFGSTTQPADGQQRDFQFAALMWLESTDQIFSML